MDLLNSRISIRPQFSPQIQFLTWKSRKIPPSLFVSSSRKYLLRPSFSRHQCRSFSSTKWQISARHGRPNSRQNYLRKKLTQQQQQQPQRVSHIQYPVRKFDKSDVHEPNFGVSNETIVTIEKNLDNESKVESFSQDDTNLESDSPGVCINVSQSAEESESKLMKNTIGESIMWNKLENWLDQYKKDSEFWGIGTGPIFTIFQNSEGKVDRVVVNEDEIMRRGRIDLRLYNDTDDLSEVNHKISFAKDLAKEMEKGSNVIPKNSSVAKFLQSGGKSHFMEVIRGVTLKPGLFPKTWRVRFFVLCGLCLIWAVGGIFSIGGNSKELTRLEKEILWRKMKARAGNEEMAKGSVEIMEPPVEPKSISLKRPQLNKEELVNSIIKAKGSFNEMDTVEDTGFHNKEQKVKIEEIRAMARNAREIERKDSLVDDHGKEDYRVLEDLSIHNLSSQNEFQTKTEPNPFTDGGVDEKCETEFYNVPNVTESLTPEASNMKQEPRSWSTNEANQPSEGPSGGPYVSPSRKKLRIIKSAKEAREYLSMKHKKLEVNRTDYEVRADIASGKTSKKVDLTNEVHDPPLLIEAHDFSQPSEDYITVSEKAVKNMDSLDDLRKSRISSGKEVSVSNKKDGKTLFEMPEKKEGDIGTSQYSDSKNELSSFPGRMLNSSSIEVGSVSEDTKKSKLSDRHEVADVAEDKTAGLAPSVKKENWLDKNFHEFEPIVEKIGAGFKENYWVAREKASQQLDLKTELTQIKSEIDDGELAWMKDERLREIVFKVRDNELSGRDPFHLMEEEDKRAFFSGLDKKVKQENEKLLNLHEYFHSNIENLDYGADGISLYDPPEKIIPRWKVPPAESNPEFLNNFVEKRKARFSESLKNSISSEGTGKNVIHKTEKPSSHQNSQMAENITKPGTEPQTDNLAFSRTTIQGSNGSIKAGKKSGKEFWEHTKKWSEGFLKSYSAETDPEVKAVMRDMGKDLDRWITEKEIQEAADFMDKIPDRGQKFIKEKLDRVKREMELFGPQAVVSKYREYGEDKEEDYLWWLDLPSILCIELYTVENGEQRVGLYSLEMAADLELDPKQYHVIAFEHAGDCKNLCYIVQAHLDVLGNGNAFVVARPPKDAFREAKANGFSVTVIRKDQLQLNIDQTQNKQLRNHMYSTLSPSLSQQTWQQNGTQNPMTSAADTQHGSTRDLNRHPALHPALHPVHEHLQHPNSPHQRHPRFYLHRPPRPVAHAADGRPFRRRERVLLQIELRGHLLPLPAADFPGRYEDDADRIAGVDQLQRAVVVGELVPVRVRHGDELEELEVDGAV